MGAVIGVDPGKREVDESALKFVVTLHDKVYNVVCNLKGGGYVMLVLLRVGC